MALNAVECRLLELRSLWEGFTRDPAKRLLVWEAPGSTLRLIECFFEAQKHEAEYSTRDLCIVLKAPFENSLQYSRALKEVLTGIYEASRAELEREGIPADWQFAAEGVPDSAWGFVEALRSFGGRHHIHIGHLAAVLMPTEVSSDRAFAGWVSRALNACSPERLRIAVVDPGEAPRLRTLAGVEDPRVLHQVPALDILTVAQETFAQEAVSGPAAVFRNLLMALVALVEKGTADQVRAKATDVYDFARRQGWDDQQVAIGIMVAGAQLKERRFDEAVHTYQFAGTAAAKAVQAGHPSGRKLVVQALFGEAGAHLAAGRTAEAARCYDAAAEAAEAIPDTLLLIEALRMGAFCRARMDDAEGALERGRQALAVGGNIRAEVRNITTLPVAATDMLRVIDPERTVRIEEVCKTAETRAEAALCRAEERATALECVDDRGAFEVVECELEAGRGAAWAEAEDRLQDLVAGGSPRFREAFDVGRALLGPAWPLGAEAAGVAPVAASPVRRLKESATP